VIKKTLNVFLVGFFFFCNLSANETVSIQDYCELLNSIDPIRQRVLTLNNFGANYCFTTELTEAFLNECQNAPEPLHVLEIGAAYGIKSSQIVQTPASFVINDIEPKHLEIIQDNFKVLISKNSNFSKPQFCPGSYLKTSLSDLGDKKFDAILIESVIHFYTPEQTVQMIEKLYNDLNEGGKVFIMVSSPFLRYIHEVYATRKEKGEEWPGYFADLETEVNELFARLHKPYHTFDQETLTNVLVNAGFEILEAHYTALPHHEYQMALDGREGLMIIAKKPNINEVE
jgi:2-polyprenyl-3-methyl-5-hydroxy-6-metoxy-1,4-benzoquinol methylase